MFSADTIKIPQISWLWDHRCKFLDVVIGYKSIQWAVKPFAVRDANADYTEYGEAVTDMRNLAAKIGTNAVRIIEKNIWSHGIHIQAEAFICDF